MRKSKTIPVAIGVFVSLVCLAALVPDGLAQSAFTGLVKDQTGAVLPGVSVEASSPALIEKARSTLTDEGGVYRIIDLRPGTNTRPFRLPGLSTVERDAEQPYNFTSQLNA